MFILSSASLHKYGLNRIFEIAKELEFDGLEISMNDTYDTYDPDYLAKLVNTFNLPITALKVQNTVNTPTQVKESIEVAEAIKVPILTIRAPYFTDFKFTSWFKRYLPKLQDKTNVKIAVENVPAGNGFILPKYALRSLEELKKFQYICLDTSHLVSRNIDLMKAYDKLKKQIACIHLSNWYKSHEHWLLHEGILPLESFLTKLVKDNYDGPISLKVDLDSLGGENLKQVFKNLQKCKEFYQMYYGKYLK